MSRFDKAIGMGLAFTLLAGCGGDPGADPEHVEACSKEEPKDYELIVDSPDPLKNPESLAAFANTQDTDAEDEAAEREGMFRNRDSINGLGEIACRDESGKITRLYLLETATELVEDYTEYLDEQENTPQGVLDDIRGQQATSTTTTLG